MSEPFTVPAPGVFEIDEEQYHADPVPEGSLSSTGARAILPPGTPAQFRYEQTHRVRKAVFDYGSAAHRLVLGTGPDIAVIDAADWRTNDAKDQRDAAYSNGAIPLLVADYETVLAMATQLRRHDIAAALFAEGTGQVEQSLFWVDAETGTWCRGRIDWIRDQSEGRVIAAEYKTCRSAAPDALAKAVADYGYHQQADWYLTGLRALGLDEHPAFVHVFQEKTPPYLVHVVEIDAYALRIGAAKNRRAIDLYTECKAKDHWPGYPAAVTSLPLPPWAETRDAEEYLSE